MATAVVDGNSPGGLSWPAALLFMFLSSLASILATVFVMNKRRSRARARAAASSASGGCIADPSCSSSVSGQPGEQYDVFLSFRGSDTRKGFGDFLYTALVDAGIRVFRDNEELSIGKEIGPELLQGIKNSAVSIPIFSVNYASSKWCLEEFAFMMECREERNQFVLPVFYDVTPNEVQHQMGTYDRAFRRHAKEKDPETILKWTKALSKVGSLKGLEVKNESNGYEGGVTKTIVTKVLNELKKGQLSVSDFLVGIDYQVNAVMRMLSVGKPDVRFVGIWGMGGIGKTTLSKTIYNNIMNDFDGCSFLQDIRETAAGGSNGLKQLQSQLVANLLRCARKDFDTTDEGVDELRRRFREKKVLILLDDVDNADQIKALAAELDWFGRGSRVIITTRDQNALSILQGHQVYEVKEMGKDDSLQLFCKHALRKDAPTEKLRPLSVEIVKRTGGLPLALEVIGSLLKGKDENVWKATSEKLKKVPNKNVQHKLRISYDALEQEQQQMFLDVACLFIGEDKRNVMYMWKDHHAYPPDQDMEALQLLSLVKISDDNKLRMHDQLRDLGREIVRQENKEPGNRSRLWGEEAFDVLKNNRGSRFIEGIRLNYNFCRFTPEQFRNLPKLRFLQLQNSELDGNFEHLLTELRWLRWRVPSSNNKATHLNLENLIILDFSWSSVSHDWNVWESIQTTSKKLKVLELSHCPELLRTPDLSEFQKLERLNLTECERLQVVDPSLSKLNHLASLKLKNSRDLKELPGNLHCKEKLQELVIDGTHVKEFPDLEGFQKLEILSAERCANFTVIPTSIGYLTSLLELRLYDSKITELPESIGNLVTLGYLNLAKTQLTKLPESIGNLVTLGHLNLAKTQLTKLPESIGNLVTLRRLRLAETSLEMLPESIGGLKSLIELVLSKTKVSILPDSIGNLINLEVLKIDHTSVQVLPVTVVQLEKLEILDASGCQFLRQLPSELGKLFHLKTLRLRHTNISSIPAETMKGLSCLETLDIACCKKLTSLSGLPTSLSSLSLSCQQLVPIPNLPELVYLKNFELVYSRVPREILVLSKLEKLYISRSNMSIKLEELGTLGMLKELYIRNVNFQCLLELPQGLNRLHVIRCQSLERLAGLSNLRNLIELRIHGCSELLEIEGIGEVPSLQSLFISSCARIAELENLEFLEHLEIYACENLERLSVFPKQCVMRGIKILWCEKLVEIQGIGYLHNLEYLDCRGCTKLKGLDGLDELENLRTLDISRCESIEKLSNLSKLKSLQCLHVVDCKKLGGLDGLDELNLCELDISRCKGIEKLPNLSKLKSLEYLYAEGCKKLGGLDGLDEVKNLRMLDISRCKGIEKLPNLSKLKSLEYLRAEDCKKLGGLDGLDEVKNLNMLDISRCKGIEKLPNLSKLKSLEYLGAEDCKKLGGLDGLDKLGELNSLCVSKCESIEKLPNLANLKALRSIKADDCDKLLGLEGLQSLQRMKWLSISGCKAIERLPDLSNLKRLECLFADRCENLQRLEGLESLERLKSLNISRCKEIKRLPNLSNLKRLEYLWADRCENLQGLEGLDSLESLISLDISGCREIERLPNLTNLKLLKVLWVDGCEKLQGLDGIENLEILRSLGISRCKSIERLPDLTNLKLLEALWTDSYEKLQGLVGSLKSLGISGCKEIERLPDLSNLKSLKYLWVNGCENFQGLEGLERLESLKSLGISGCKEIESLSDLSNFKSLKYLWANGCEKLKGLEGLESLESLKLLCISGCKEIERLPDLSNFKSLKYLWADGCEKLQGLIGLDKIGEWKRLSVKDCKSIESLPNAPNIKFSECSDDDGCDKLQKVKEQKSKNLKESGTRLYFGIENFLHGNDIKKLQELDGWDGLISVGECCPYYLSDELLGESNFGLLRQWYADGCENAPQLEGLENLQNYHLHVLPDSNEFLFYPIVTYS